MRAVVIAFALALAVAATAHADTYVGAGADPRGDQAGAGAGTDITGGSLEYDSEVGRFTAVATLAGKPSGTPAELSIVAGNRAADGGCRTPVFAFLSPFDGPTTRWARDDDDDGVAEARGFGTRRYLSGNRVVLATEQLFLRDLSFDCMQLVTLRLGGATFDTSPVFELAKRPPAPRLVVVVRGVPKRLKRGRTVRARVQIANLGDAPATEVRVAIGRARGLRTKLGRRYFTLIPVGQSVPTTLRLRLTSRARRATEVGVAARGATGPRARRGLTLRR